MVGMTWRGMVCCLHCVACNWINWHYRWCDQPRPTDACVKWATIMQWDYCVSCVRFIVANGHWTGALSCHWFGFGLHRPAGLKVRTKTGMFST